MVPRRDETTARIGGGESPSDPNDGSGRLSAAAAGRVSGRTRVRRRGRRGAGGRGGRATSGTTAGGWCGGGGRRGRRARLAHHVGAAALVTPEVHHVGTLGVLEQLAEAAIAQRRLAERGTLALHRVLHERGLEDVEVLALERAQRLDQQ